MQKSIHSQMSRLHQKHLLAGYEGLSSDQKEQFAQQMSKYDRLILERQHTVLFSQSREVAPFKPLHTMAYAGSAEDRLHGEDLIAQGKVACLILAGGQGSRLGIDIPKGMVPVSLVKGKTLFQLFAERTEAASVRIQRPLHLAIMTSPLNHSATQSYFEGHGYFGLPSSHVDLIQQSVLPFCDDRGNWLLEKPGKLAEGPDGNGMALHLIYASGLYDKWRASGVEYVNVILVDNPLADPFDAELIGFHNRTQAQVVVKATNRASADEKMGVVVMRNQKINVVEYSEIDQKDLHATNQDGTLCFSVANTSQFSFHLDFVAQVATDPACILPLHLARKTAPVWLSTAKGSWIEKVKVWKYETFIFDLLDFATQAQVLVYPRHLCYAPLKNATGDKSLKTVQESLLQFDRHIYTTLSGLPSPQSHFELHPCFYYPTVKMTDDWKGRELPSMDYIEKNT